MSVSTLRVVAWFGRAIGLSAVLAAIAAGPGSAQTPEATLPSKCTDQQVAPTSVILTCADAGFIAEQLAWSDWGASEASATGIASVNTCDPNCAEGGRESYSVLLRASGLRDCDYGRPQYTHVAYSFPDGGPFPRDSPGSEDPAVEFPCPKRPHADPRIRSMKLRLTGHGPVGKDYFVRVHLRLRVCAVRGRSEVVVNETKRVGRQTFGEHTRTLRFRQHTRCEIHRFRWRLRDEFFGVGTYKVAATVWDRDFQFSKTVARKKTTTD